MQKGMRVIILSLVTLGLVGCATQSPTQHSEYASDYGHPSKFSRLPSRSGESTDTRRVAGYPEGHPLNTATRPEGADVHTHTSNSETQFELD